MRHFIKRGIYLIIILLILFISSEIIIKNQALANDNSSEVVNSVNEFINPLRDLIGVVDTFLNKFEAKLNQNPLVQNIISRVPQTKEDVIALLNRSNGIFGGIINWFENAIGMNIYTLLIVIKNLFLAVFKLLISLVKGVFTLFS